MYVDVTRITSEMVTKARDLLEPAGHGPRKPSWGTPAPLQINMEPRKGNPKSRCLQNLRIEGIRQYTRTDNSGCVVLQEPRNIPNIGRIADLRLLRA